MAGSAVSAGNTALAALMDLRDTETSTDEDDRQKKLLLQLQRTKWLAQHGKLAKSSTANSSSSSLGIDLAKSVRLKELESPTSSYMDRMTKDRNAYSSE